MIKITKRAREIKQALIICLIYQLNCQHYKNKTDKVNKTNEKGSALPYIQCN